METLLATPDPQENPLDDYPAMWSAFEAYLLHERGRSPATVYAYSRALDRVLGFLDVVPSALDATGLRRFIREADCGSAAKKITVNAVKTWHRWAVLEGLKEPNALEAVHTPRVFPTQAPPLNLEQVNTLVKRCDSPRDHRLIWLGLFAGLRIGESATITASSWLPDRIVVLGKGRKVREVPVHPALRSLRDLILQDEETPALPDYHRRGAAMSWSRRMMEKRAGFMFKPHSLRRTFATRLYEADVAFEVVGELLGHAGNVTSLYAQVSWSRKVRAIQSLDYDEVAGV